jgi:predicted GH43/DUF377 family glycosyl hydrolase
MGRRRSGVLKAEVIVDCVTEFLLAAQVSARILFPAAPSHRNGFEDARFARFRDDDGAHVYYATFTAFDGRVVVPELVETSDFLNFRFITLNGPENKGMVLSHGVGPMRQYAIGAFLLDRDDPSKVIGRLREPLLKPNENEREGYVPNVAYPCGALVHDGELIIPYGMADHSTGFATVPLAEVLAAMEPEYPSQA